VADPYIATTAVAALVRRSASFHELLEQKMSLGTAFVRDLGNLYSAALPSWLAAGFEEAARTQIDLTHRPMVAVGYGSGDAAEAWPIHAVAGWQAAASRIFAYRATENPIDLTRAQYEALHDGHEVEISYVPQAEFVISHVGECYGSSFQDLGVEYYQYVG
jgi:hydroxymethylglutaryl-CoA synthase